MFSIAICDDEEILCSRMEMYLEQLRAEGVVHTEVFYSSEALCRALEGGEHFDLVFLDIQFSRMSGIEAGKTIREELNNEKIQIVYISGKQEYAMELFQVRPMNFLIKPLSRDDVIANVKKAMALSDRQKICFEYKTGSGTTRIPYGDILFFESDNRKIKIHTVYGTKEMYGKLNDISGRCPDSFLRIHQSFLVNRIYISSWKAREVVMQSGDSLPVSQTYRKKINEQMLDSKGW